MNRIAKFQAGVLAFFVLIKSQSQYCWKFKLAITFCHCWNFASAEAVTLWQVVNYADIEIPTSERTKHFVQ